VWYPTWALKRPDVLHDQPAQAVDDSSKVVARNELAAGYGIEVGMPRRSAEALCPTVSTIVRDRTADMARFEQVVAVIELLVPMVEIAEPGIVFIPIGGAVRYYGGEQSLVDRVSKEIAVLGGDYRIGLARGPFAAYQAARATTPGEPELLVDDDGGFLASLDVGTLTTDDLAATFRWLGITTLGALAELPRDAVISRFGSTGLDAHTLASGIDRSVDPRTIPEDPAVESSFDPPIEDFEQVSFVARNLSQRLISGLAARGIAPHRVIVIATAGDGTVRSRTWRSADPFSDRTLADRVRWQLRAWIDGVAAGIHGGLASLRLEPADLSGSGRQMGLQEDAKSFEEMQRAFMEVQAIAGSDNVVVALPQGGRDPGQRVMWTRWGDEAGVPPRDPDAPWPGQIPGPAPALVPPDSVLFEVSWVDGMPEHVRLKSRWVPVLSWAGPWRSVGRWWHGETAADRYQIVTSVGAYLCEIREGRTYLIGVYD
jgi:protein ImuB